MEVVSISPFRTGSVLWRPRPDRWTLTVVCKATYALEPGESALAADQEPVHERDVFWEDDARLSVYQPSDLAPFKPRADVILVGHAYAPRSEVVRSLTARLMVGEMEKAVEVFCPRVLGREGELREGQRWSKMPLRYEYAAGGLSTWNPVGVGPTAPADQYGQRPLPNLQPPGLRLTQWGDIFVPTGFGPISPSWRLRRDKLGRRAEGWTDAGWTQIALDDDFDGEFFQAAPSDQQIDAVRDDERIVLEYLNPDHPSLATKLPGVHPRAFVEIPGSAPRDLVMTADTLWIDTDRAIVTLTWRGQVAVDGPEQAGRILVAIEEAGQHLNWTALAAQPATMGGTPTTPGGTEIVTDAAAGGPRPRPTLPFMAPDAPTLVPAPPESRDDTAEPAPTPRTVEPRRTPPPEPPPLTPPPQTPPMPAPRVPGPRATLQMGSDVVGALPAWLAPTAKAEAPLIEETTIETTQVSLRLDALRAAARPPERALELTWFSPTLGGRLREIPEWAAILPARSEGEAAPGLDVAAVLSRVAPSVADLERTLFNSVSDEGTLSPSPRVLRGELAFLFDEVEEIRALIAAAMPIARADMRLAGLLDFATEMAKTELQGSPDVAAELGGSIRDAWAMANQMLPASHLAEQVERALLARRCYQRRELLGARWIRALFTAGGEAAPVPAYLPAGAASRLPIFRRFPVRLLAEVVPQQDQQETSAVALRVGAVAREVVRRG